jgi:hypothetical protein
MPPCRRLAALLTWVVSAACSTSKVEYGAGRDMELRDVLAYAEANIFNIPRFEELSPGTGRVAQWERKLTLDVEVADDAGKALGAGTITVLHPRPVENGFEYYPAGGLSEEFWAGVVGMREGGRRRFTIESRCGDFSGQECRLHDAGGGVSLEYPNHARVRFTVALLRVCRPRFVRVTSWSIPSSRRVEIKERSCD